MPTGQKSPLHPSALTINGLTPGRTVVRFNRYSAYRQTFVVLERPVVRSVILSPESTPRPLFVVVIPLNATVVHANSQVVKLRDVETGEWAYHHLTDLGVVSICGQFNDANCVVDYRKRHLLPTTRVPRPYRLFCEEDFFEDERFFSED